MVRATAINPALLIWARERSGLSVEEAARRVGKTADVLASWERGDEFPTYNQLETLAESVYRRPVALFFLPEPPEETPIQRQFRMLPEAELDALAPDTRFALRDARAYQQSLRELTGGRNPSSRFITRDLHAGLDSNPERLARDCRDYLDVTLSDQRKWSSTRVAMNEWRGVVESAGVFVFKRSFKQAEISGFCVHDDEFPVIIVNNSTAFARQIFTLFHELAHLLYGISSITKDDQAYLTTLSGPDRVIELACNRFAAEFLIPAESFPWEDFRSEDAEAFISSVAARYHVSREVVLRRLVDRGLMDQAEYSVLVRRWAEEGEGRSGESGGNYYATQTAYLGRTFLSLAFGQLRAGRISAADLSEHLNIKARNIGKLEDFLAGAGR